MSLIGIRRKASFKSDLHVYAPFSKLVSNLIALLTLEYCTDLYVISMLSLIDVPSCGDDRLWISRYVPGTDFPG